MRRIAIGAAFIGGVVIVARALAPKLHAPMLAACKGMFEQMPEDCPPKRMMAGIEEVPVENRADARTPRAAQAGSASRTGRGGFLGQTREVEMVHA